jgi:hypothetical protein
VVVCVALRAIDRFYLDIARRMLGPNGLKSNEKQICLLKRKKAFQMQGRVPSTRMARNFLESPMNCFSFLVDQDTVAVPQVSWRWSWRSNLLALFVQIAELLEAIQPFLIGNFTGLSSSSSSR